MNSLPQNDVNIFKLDVDQLQKATLESLKLARAYLEDLSHNPVKSQVQPGEMAGKCPIDPPNEAKDLQEIFDMIQTNIVPAVTQWQHPRFFSYYPAATSVPAIMSEFLIAALGSVGLQWSANPAATELECVVMDWLLKMIHATDGSPFLHRSQKGGGLIQNTAGEAMAIIMVAARVEFHKKRLQSECPNDSLNREDLYWQDSSSLVVYMSDQTHFSGPKAVRVAGMRLHKIKATLLDNGNFGITAKQVSQAMEEDRKNGLKPCAVLLNYGSTNTCGYDHLESFVGFGETEGVWVHVDAAYAGASLILPEFQAQSLIIQEIAHSFNFNGSKWFLCGFDSAFLFVRDRNLLKQVFSADGDYLARVSEESIYNPEFKDWAIPLGRRFRALRIWMVLNYFGSKGLRNYLRRTIDQANYARNFIDKSSYLKQVVKTELGLVCFRHQSDDVAVNNAFIRKIEELSDSGRKFLLYPSLLNGQSILRLALGGVNTDLDDIQFILDICESAAKDLTT